MIIIFKVVFLTKNDKDAIEIIKFLTLIINVVFFIIVIYLCICLKFVYMLYL